MILAPMLRSPQLGDPGYQRVRILGSICALRTPNKSLHWMFLLSTDMFILLKWAFVHK